MTEQETVDLQGAITPSLPPHDPTLIPRLVAKQEHDREVRIACADGHEAAETVDLSACLRELVALQALERRADAVAAAL